MASPSATRRGGTAARRLPREPIRSVPESPDATTLLESLPLGVVLVDAERRLHALNGVARRILEVSDARAALGQGVGDLIRCVEAVSQPQGCGRSRTCRDCVLWQVADEAIRGTATTQREVTFRVQQEGRFVDRVFLVSAAPYGSGNTRASGIAAVLVFQDVTPLHRLQGLLPICAGCKRIRRDDRAWERLEHYIESHSHALFTHSLCPRCMGELYPDLELEEEGDTRVEGPEKPEV